MKRAKNGAESNRSLRTFFSFCVIVLCLILISLSIKLFFLVRDSSFDGQQRFTLEVKHSDKKTSIVTFEPLSNSLSIISFTHRKEISFVQKSLSIPIDGVINDPSQVITKSNLKQKLYGYMLRVTTGVGVNSFDVARLIFFAQGMQGKDIDLMEINDKNIGSQVLNEVFIDRRVVDEGLTIAIVNAADSPGLGARLEGIFNRLGFNVVSVTTSPSLEKNSRIEYTGDSSYTFSQIQNKLSFPAKESPELGISDILIVLGEDALERTDF